jgi:adenylosuccinate synthase
VDRSQVPNLKITMADIYNGMDLEPKLHEICGKYARFRTGTPINEPKMMETFIKSCKALPEVIAPAGIGQCKDPLFEGAQGLLLSQDNKKDFPHVSRSYTGMRNIRKLCAQAGIKDIVPYYVSRTYLTRHGAGPLPGEDPKMSYEDDTNNENTYQGKLRFAALDYDALVDRIAKDADGLRYKLAITHRDQLERQSLLAALSSYGPTRDDVRKGA